MNTHTILKAISSLNTIKQTAHLPWSMLCLLIGICVSPPWSTKEFITQREKEGEREKEREREREKGREREREKATRGKYRDKDAKRA